MFVFVRILGFKMTVVQADRQNVHPVSVDEFHIAVAKTYTVIVESIEDKAYTVLPKPWIAVAKPGEPLRPVQTKQYRFPRGNPDRPGPWLISRVGMEKKSVM